MAHAATAATARSVSASLRPKGSSQGKGAALTRRPRECCERAADRIPLEDLGMDPSSAQASPTAGGGSVKSVLRARLAQLQARCEELNACLLKV